MTTELSKRSVRRRGKRSWRDVLRYIVHQRAAPESIARGLAIGLIVTFTPTVGIQIPLALLLATLFNANRWTAILPVWLTNVLTVPPTYAFTYWLGSHFVRTSTKSPWTVMKTLAKRMNRHEFYYLHRHFREFFELSRDLFIPMTIGGLIVGGTAAAIAYPLTLHWIRRHRAQRRQRVQRRAIEFSLLHRFRLAAPQTDTPRPLPESNDGKTRVSDTASLAASGIEGSEQSKEPPPSKNE